MSDEIKHLITHEEETVNVLACGETPTDQNCTKRPQEVTCQACLEASGNVPEDEDD